MTMIDEEQASEILREGRKEAEAVLSDPARTEELLQELEVKLQQEEELKDKLPGVSVMISLIRDYVRKEYTEISEGTVLYVMSGLLYLLYPIDYVPDILPEVGYSDDELVIAKLYAWVEEDLRVYQESKRA